MRIAVSFITVEIMPPEESGPRHFVALTCLKRLRRSWYAKRTFIAEIRIELGIEYKVPLSFTLLFEALKKSVCLFCGRCKVLPLQNDQNCFCTHFSCFDRHVLLPEEQEDLAAIQEQNCSAEVATTCSKRWQSGWQHTMQYHMQSNEILWRVQCTQAGTSRDRSV